MNKQAAKAIILAQVASDGGKGIVELIDALPKSLSVSADKAWNAGYAFKDELLERACIIVARHHEKDIRFFVTKDEEKIAKFIVYFDVHIGGTRWQASFHSFSNRWEKWTKSTAPSKGHWDHKSSRETCLELAKFF